MFGNIQQIPTFAKVVIAICIVVFLLTAIDVVPLRKLCLNEVISVYLLHWSRLHQLLTSHFAHVGFFHIFFNLSAYAGFGADFERKLGSALCAYFTVVLCVTASILHLIFAYVIMWLPLSSSAPISQYFLIVPPVGCSVGLSSLLFALIVIRYNDPQSREQPQSFLFCLQVRGKYLPWAFLGLFALFPGVSLLGHLGGIAAGYVFSYGYLQRLSLSPAVTARIDRSSIVARLVSLCGTSGGVGWIAASDATAADTSASAMQLPLVMPPASSSSSSDVRNDQFPGVGFRLSTGEPVPPPS